MKPALRQLCRLILLSLAVFITNSSAKPDKPLGMDRTTLRPLMAITYPFAHGHAIGKIEFLFTVLYGAKKIK